MLISEAFIAFHSLTAKIHVTYFATIAKFGGGGGVMKTFHVEAKFVV